MQRLRVRYAKRGRARFASHRDFARAFERALRRAGVPMAYSSGFTPHPRISYANASPTGAASEAEYLEIGLAAPCDPGELRVALDAALPLGLHVLEVRAARPGALTDLLTASRWRIDLLGVAPEVLADAVAALLATQTLSVERRTKTGPRGVDARRAILELTTGPDASLQAVLRHDAPLVRAADVLDALSLIEPAVAPSQPPLLTRIEQGRWIDGRVVGPFDTDTELGADGAVWNTGPRSGRPAS